MELSKNDRPTLAQMASALREVDDESWGAYLFSRDILRDRVTPERKSEMIAKSTHCGQEYAERIAGETGARTPDELPSFFGLRVASGDVPMTEKRVLFASFTPPDGITVMKEPLRKYGGVLAGLPPEEAALLPTESEVYSILLGHELFHFVEERHKDEIYTRTEKIRLWKIFGFENDSTIRALGEIAGMAFTKALCRVPFSPSLLDVLLLYSYNENYSREVYGSVMDIFAHQRVDRG